MKLEIMVWTILDFDLEEFVRYLSALTGKC